VQWGAAQFMDCEIRTAKLYEALDYLDQTLGKMV